jgi:hypothetical protein
MKGSFACGQTGFEAMMAALPMNIRLEAIDGSFAYDKLGDSFGVLWISMDSYVFLWIPMDSFGVLWNSMDFYGFLWIPVDS